MHRKSLGHYGEQLAKQYLEDLGYQILHLNWRFSRIGEIDIVAYQPHKQCLSFIEVKTRRSHTYGQPLEAIGPAQRDTLQMLGEAYIATETQDLAFENVSFDLITVQPRSQTTLPPIIDFYPSAF